MVLKKNFLFVGHIKFVHGTPFYDFCSVTILHMGQWY